MALRPASGAAARLCSVPSDPERRASTIRSSISFERFADDRRAIVPPSFTRSLTDLNICPLNYPVIENFSVPAMTWPTGCRESSARTVDAVKVDGMLVGPLACGRRPGAGARGRRLLRRLDHRGRQRSVPSARPRRRALHVARTRHGDRRGVRPQPDDARPHGVGPAGGLGRPVHPRTRLADQAAHHQAVLDAVEPSGGADARADPGDPGDLGHVDDRRAAAVPRRVLHPHADDPVLLPEPRRRRRVPACRASSSPGSARR